MEGPRKGASLQPSTSGLGFRVDGLGFRVKRGGGVRPLFN